MHATIAGETSAFGWLSKVMAWQLDLVSHLPPDECVRRLRAKTGRWKGAWTVYLGGWKVFSDDPIVTDSEVIGHVGETSLRICRRVPNENAFQIWLFGKLKNENGGTRLRCRFGLNPLVVVLAALWLWGAVLFFLGGGDVVAVRLMGYSFSLHGWWIAIIAPLLLTGIGVVIMSYCLFLSREEPRFLIAFLRDVIDAREVPLHSKRKIPWEERRL